MPIQMLSFLLNLTGEITLKNCNNTSDKLATDRLKTNVSYAMIGLLYHFIQFSQECNL